MATINLRGIDGELKAQLKSEAALAGIHLVEYCVAIFKSRDSGLLVLPKVGNGKAGKDKESSEKQNFSDVARGAGGVFGTPGFVVGSEVVPVVARPLESVEGAELNSADALAGLGISSPVAPVYGGVERHNTSTCRIHKCLMCEAIKLEGK